MSFFFVHCFVVNAFSIKAVGDYLLGLCSFTWKIYCVHVHLRAFNVFLRAAVHGERGRKSMCVCEQLQYIVCIEARAIINPEKKSDYQSECEHRLALFHNRLISLIFSACM